MLTDSHNVELFVVGFYNIVASEIDGQVDEINLLCIRTVVLVQACYTLSTGIQTAADLISTVRAG